MALIRSPLAQKRAGAQTGPAADHAYMAADPNALHTDQGPYARMAMTGFHRHLFKDPGKAFVEGLKAMVGSQNGQREPELKGRRPSRRSESFC